MQTNILHKERQEENGGAIVKRNILIVILCVFAFFAMGAMRRTSPTFWRAVSGGIELVSGSVTITSGDLTLSSGNLIVTDTIKHEYGGLEGDVSGYGGLVGITGGSTVDVNTSAEVITAIADETGSGALVFGTAPTIADPTVTGVVTITTDVHPIVRTVIKTINLDSSDDDEDFEFDDSQGNVTEQTVDMGAIIPTYAAITSIQIRCFETVAGSGSAVMAIDIGTASGGAQLLTTADIDTANDIKTSAAGTAPEVPLAATAAAKNVWINATPDANWDTLTAGRWSVMVTYIDYGAVHTKKNP